MLPVSLPFYRVCVSFWVFSSLVEFLEKLGVWYPISPLRPALFPVGWAVSVLALWAGPGLCLSEVT